MGVLPNWQVGLSFLFQGDPRERQLYRISDFGSVYEVKVKVV